MVVEFSEWWKKRKTPSLNLCWTNIAWKLFTKKLIFSSLFVRFQKVQFFCFIFFFYNSLKSLRAHTVVLVKYAHIDIHPK